MYLHVTVTPKAKKEKVIKKGDDHYEISVKELGERNLANKRVCEVLASEFSVPVRKVRIVNGHHHRKKLVIIEE